MKDLNTLRLLAGLPIDGKIEITESKKPATRLTESTGKAVDKFFMVFDASSDSEFGDVFHEGNTRSLINICRSLSIDEIKTFKIFTDQQAAMDEAKSRIQKAKFAKVSKVAEGKKADKDYDGDGKIESSEDEHKGAVDKAIKKATAEENEEQADKDYDGDGKIETSAEEHKGAVDKAIKKALKEDDDDDDDNDDNDEVECPKCDGNGVEDDDETGKETSCKLCKGSCKVVEESMHHYNINYASWVNDKNDPVNVASSKADQKSHDLPDSDRDESPSQMGSSDTTKVVVPANILKQLKDEAAQARREAKNLDRSNRDASYFYEDLARAFDDLHNHLAGATVHDIKMAQIFMTSLMGPMLHKIPADVVRFITYAGQPRSLKSYMQKV